MNDVKNINGGRSKDAPRIAGAVGLGPVPWGANKFCRLRNKRTQRIAGFRAWAAREIHAEELKAHLGWLPGEENVLIDKTGLKHEYFVRTGKRVRAARRV